MMLNTQTKAMLPTCNVCGAQVDRILLTKDELDVHQCPDCGLAFTHPQPESVAEQYDDSYFEIYRKRRDFRLRRSDARLTRIETIRKPGRLLDVGCSLGYFVEAAMRRGWDARGVEISSYAAAEARKMGLDVCTGVLQDALFADGSFDCVTMWDVLEHVTDPVEHMIEIRRVLADDGLVVIGTPDLGHVLFQFKRDNWRHLKPAEHIFYFQRRSICRLLDRAGFKMVAPSGVRTALTRFTQFNDVMTVYGVKNGL